MRWTLLAAALLGDLLLAPAIVLAQDALWLQPSSKWYGIDGNWSSFDLLVGSPGQLVSLMVSTALSEIWVVENSGCPNNPLCTTARGGVYDTKASASWIPLGAWQLGLKDLGLGGNGDYGLDTVLVTNTVTRITTSVDGALIAALNDTDYYEGFIGIGATQGRFGDKVVNPYITQLAESYGTIPSHSYGFTAGAYYVGSGVPASLTLGGYDSLRFWPHDITFNMNPSNVVPQVFLRGVTAAVPSIQDAPTHWNTTSWPLLGYNVSNMADIDTSTPYLWLPAALCDNFAAALNLTWSEDFGVYVFTDASEYPRFQNSPLSFTFSLSSFDNTDNFGEPLNVAGVVNITVPAAAFAQLLRYPFANNFTFGDPAVPYFPLKRSEGNRVIIGRAFMQEAYMIMCYDQQTFGIHQARFPDAPYRNYSLVDIKRPTDSIYPASPAHHTATGLSTGAIIGIVVCALLLTVVVALTTWCYYFRRRRGNKEEKTKAKAKSKSPREEEPGAMDDESFRDRGDQPTSPVERLLSMLRSRRGPRRRREVLNAHEVAGDHTQPVEVAADAHHEVYELPAPLGPTELESNDPASADELTHLGTEGTQGLTPYEAARQRLGRQLQGPVPTYTLRSGPAHHPSEKSDQDVSPVTHYRSADDPSPVSWPTYGNGSNTMPSVPSPLSPYPPEWGRGGNNLPSPITAAPSFPPAHFPSHHSSPDAPVSPHPSLALRTYEPSMSRTNSTQPSPVSASGSSLMPPSALYQKTPIDAARVICLGPLPDNIQLPRLYHSLPRLAAPSRQETTPSPVSPVSPVAGSTTEMQGHRRPSTRSTDTLGSDYTVEETTRLQEEMSRQQSLQSQNLQSQNLQSQQGQQAGQQQAAQQHAAQQGMPRSARSQERIDTGLEIIHVPQLAEKRYSWEDER